MTFGISKLHFEIAKRAMVMLMRGLFQYLQNEDVHFEIFEMRRSILMLAEM